MVLGMFAAFIYRKKMVLKKKRIAATQLLYEDSLLKLKKLQAELLQLQEEQDNKMSLMIREKEEAIGKLKEEVKDIRAKFSNPLLSDMQETPLYRNAPKGANGSGRLDSVGNNGRTADSIFCSYSERTIE